MLGDSWIRFLIYSFAAYLNIISIFGVFVGFFLNHGNDRRYGFFLTRLPYVKNTIRISFMCFLISNGLFNLGSTVLEKGSVNLFAKDYNFWPKFTVIAGVITLIFSVWLAKRVLSIVSNESSIICIRGRSFGKGRNEIIHEFLLKVEIYTPLPSSCTPCQKEDGWEFLRQLSVAVVKAENEPYALAVWVNFITGQGLRAKTQNDLITRATGLDIFKLMYYTSDRVCMCIEEDTVYNRWLINEVFFKRLMTANSCGRGFNNGIRKYVIMGFLLGMFQLGQEYRASCICRAFAFLKENFLDLVNNDTDVHKDDLIKDFLYCSLLLLLYFEILLQTEEINDKEIGRFSRYRGETDIFLSCLSRYYIIQREQENDSLTDRKNKITDDVTETMKNLLSLRQEGLPAYNPSAFEDEVPIFFSNFDEDINKISLEGNLDWKTRVTRFLWKSMQ